MSDTTDRAVRIQQLIDEHHARRLAGGAGSDADLIATHPDLMPELGRELRKWSLIQHARQQAGSSAAWSLEDATEVTDPGSISQDDARGTASAIPFEIPGYQIVREVHRGGQGVVYLAVQQSTRREVAIKVMKHGPLADPADRLRFQREVQVLAQLSHPNIVTIHDSGSAAGQSYIVMDFVDGRPLDAYLADQFPISDFRFPIGQPESAERRAQTGNRKSAIDNALRLFAEVCDAVHAAHLHGIIHRDLKPGNILVVQAGSSSHGSGGPPRTQSVIGNRKPAIPKVLDFGLAKLTGDSINEGNGSSGAAALTVTGQFVGSLPWASPEQAGGDPGQIDIRTDVYSLGVILYQILTGTFPYPVAGHLRDVLNNILTAEPVRPSAAVRTSSGSRRSATTAADEELDTIVLKCLNKDPARRYQSAGALASDIRSFLAGEPIEAKRDSSTYLLRKYLRRYRWHAGLAAVFVFIVTLGFVTSFTLWRRAAADRDSAERSRKVADAARLAEAEQRSAAQESAVLAKQEAEHARTAEALADRRAKELQTIVNFQQAMLGDVDAEAMGLRIVEELQTRAGLDDQTRDVLQQAITAQNATNLALMVLDEQVLQRALAIIDRDFTDQPAIEAALRHAVAATYMRLDMHDEALPQIERALALRRQELGDDHADTRQSITFTANALHALGRMDEADVLYAEALERSRRVLGKDDAEAIAALGNVATLRHFQGRFVEADALRRERIERARRVFGDTHPETLLALSQHAFTLMAQGLFDEAESELREVLGAQREALGNEADQTIETASTLASLLIKRRRLNEAEPLLRECLETLRRRLGDEHRQTLILSSNLALLLKNQGRLDEALQLVRRNCEVARRVLGDESTVTLDALTNLATVLEERRELEEAETVLREVVETRRRVTGSDHPGTLLVINNLALLLQRRGQLDQAEPLFREALEGQRRSLGDGHADTLTTLSNLAMVLYAQGKQTDAEAAFRESFVGTEKALGRAHPLTLTSINNLGVTLQALGRLDEAEALLREAVAGRKAALPENHPFTVSSMNSLASVLQDQRRLDEAAELYQDVLAIRRSAANPNPADIAASATLLGSVLTQAGRPADAEPLLREALETRTNLLPPDHWLLANTRSLLGACLIAQTRYDEAEPLVVAGYEQMNPPPAASKRKREALERVIRLYTAWDKPDQASEYRAKLALDTSADTPR